MADNATGAIIGAPCWQGHQPPRCNPSDVIGEIQSLAQDFGDTRNATGVVMSEVEALSLACRFKTNETILNRSGRAQLFRKVQVWHRRRPGRPLGELEFNQDQSLLARSKS
jgi:hypothetical protein